MAEACRDPIRRSFELDLACDEETQATTLLMPLEPLQKGVGGEILPRPSDDLPGVELALKEPDLLNAEASEQRAKLLERCNALELGIETAQETQAGDTVQKMLAHQMAAAHVRAMTLLDEAGRSKDPDVSIRKSRAAARLMDAFSRGALTLQKLQGGGNQTIQVQHVQVVGQAVIGMGGVGENLQKPIGRPPTHGDRTARAIAERKVDKELLDDLAQLSGLPL
jgi:hypothetical protein